MAETASTIEADGSSDADVAAALGIEGAEQDQQAEGSEDQESDEQEVGAELDRMRREIATLRREAAERRVRDKAAAKANSTAPEATDVEAARRAGREEAQQEYGIRLASAEVRTALTGVVPEDKLSEIVEDLNLARYVGDDGEPDTDAIKALREKYRSLLGARKTAKVSHGRSGNGQTSRSVQQQFEDTMAGLLNSN